MKIEFRTLLIALTAICMWACGGEEATVIDDERECGEGTVLDDDGQTCILDRPECSEDEVYLEDFNRCARVAEDYCAEGTWPDELTGRCVADEPLECAPNTVEEDEVCLPAEVVECGEGTVVHDGLCTPHDDVCGDGTGGDPPAVPCQPEEELCGENTIFDVFERVCIPISDVSCGPATTEVEGVCLPTQAFYDELAADPDLDVIGVEGPHQFDLPAVGERFVVVGNIDEPELADGEYIQDEDVFEFEADAGQWLEITLFSLGLPEPAFYLEGSDDFYRLSDLGVGIEVSRQVVVPSNGILELTIANMPQLLGEVPPAGGDDWNYVAYVQPLESPDAQAIDLFETPLSGDLRRLDENFYAASDLADVEEILLILEATGETADGELQIWSDPATPVETIKLADASVSFVPPSDSFYLLFDYVHAYGPDTYFSVRASQSQSLAAGESITEERYLNAGEYVGLFQFNDQQISLSASIESDTDVLAEASELAISSSQTGQTSLYWLADTDRTISLELHNDSGEDIDSVALSIITGTADQAVVDTGTVEVAHDEPLLRGQRHYVLADVAFDGRLATALEASGFDGEIALFDPQGQLVETSTNSLEAEVAAGTHVIYIEALEPMVDGFSLTLRESEIFDVSESSSPNLDIPPNSQPVSDTIAISSCPTIVDLSIDVEIIHLWREDLIVDITAPNGQLVNIHNGYGGMLSNIIGNYPYPDDPNLEDGEALFEFVGSNGGGNWSITVRDTFATFESNGHLASWGVNLVCEQ